MSYVSGVLLVLISVRHGSLCFSFDLADVSSFINIIIIKYYVINIVDTTCMSLL